MDELCPIKLSGWGGMTAVLVFVVAKSPNPLLSTISLSGIVIAAYWLFSGKGYIETQSVYGLEFADVRTVSRRTDRESWYHLYEVTFTATTTKAEVIETDNVTTYTGKDIKQSDIHSRDIWLHGWKGWDIDDQAMKNKIIYECFKKSPHWAKFSISLLKVTYKGEYRK
jgi:hypothetical protein